MEVESPSVSPLACSLGGEGLRVGVAISRTLCGGFPTSLLPKLWFKQFCLSFENRFRYLKLSSLKSLNLPEVPSQDQIVITFTMADTKFKLNTGAEIPALGLGMNLTVPTPL